MRKIKQISVVTREGAKTYGIGSIVNGLRIATIKDISTERNDGVEFVYLCLDEDGKLVVSIENCPAVVEYEEDHA